MAIENETTDLLYTVMTGLSPMELYNLSRRRLTGRLIQLIKCLTWQRIIWMNGIRIDSSTKPTNPNVLVFKWKAVPERSKSKTYVDY